MNNKNYDENRRLLEEMREQLQRDLGRSARCGSGRRSDHPCAAELDYHLTRLTTALSGLNQGGFRFGLYSHREQVELLAEINCLLEQTEEIHEMAERVREVLLHAPPDDKEPGFVE